MQEGRDVPDLEAMWLERLRAGGTEALSALFEHHRPRLRQMLDLRLGGRLEGRFDASDVLQETYLDAARQVEAYLRDPKVSAYVWLRGLALERLSNLVRAHHGAQRRAVCREVRLPERSSVLFSERLLARGTSPSRALMKDELRQSIERALLRLDEEDR